MDELERKLNVIASELRRRPWSISGASVDDLRLEVTVKNHSLCFATPKTSPFRVILEVSDFALIDHAKWDEDRSHMLFPSTASGVMRLAYEATVKWKNHLSHEASHVMLSYAPDRQRCLRGLAPGSSLAHLIVDILCAIDEVAMSIYEDRLCGTPPERRQRKHPEDQVHANVEVF